ncbi:MAG: SpoIIE family protein phosphatase [Anaerolineales bacterium]|nr:MAG: SpoIIE family protein phosphatase [Anaerolineales bacterium]
MLATTEKVSILKSVSIFVETPEETLAQVAALLEEVTLKSGQIIFEKGDIGASMYVIAAGRVRVHDGERTLNHLTDRDVFGEMALIDSEPRLASVTAVEDTHLLRLDQKPFYKLMDERPEVARGIIRVLSEHLRARVRDLGALRTRLERVILPLGIALSAEKNLDRLLERILVEAKAMCNADASTLYLRSDENCLRYAITQIDSLGIAMGGTTGKEIPFPPLCLVDEATGEPNYSSVATYVALSGHSINFPDVYRVEDFDFSDTQNFDRRHGYRSVSSLTVPLKDHTEQVVAVLQLFNAMDPKTGEVIAFDLYQQLVVESLASQAAVALNTQSLLRSQQALLKLEHELQMAYGVQASLLPRETPQAPGWEFAARWQPAREVSGDFYDFVPSHQQLDIVIADVSGKGMPAALFMALSRSTLRASVAATPSPAEGIQQTNRLLCADSGNSMFVTLFYAQLNPATGQMTYVNAGHNPPLLYRAQEDELIELTRTGMPLGLFEMIDFEQRVVELDPGDFILLYTDGVNEAMDADGDVFGEERLRQVLLEKHQLKVEDMAEALEVALTNFTGGVARSDDITFVIARRL